MADKTFNPSGEGDWLLFSIFEKILLKNPKNASTGSA
jgi:hypothetical protein